MKLAVFLSTMRVPPGFRAPVDYGIITHRGMDGHPRGEGLRTDRPASEAPCRRAARGAARAARQGGARRPKELHPPPVAVYLRCMERTNPPEQRQPPITARSLLEFRPWMLALAVFLGCAIG